MRGGRREGTPNWTWDGSVEFPTLRPSILTRGDCFVGNDGETENPVGHTWINQGRAEFLSDCTHEFAGQTLDLLEVPPLEEASA